MTPLQRPHAYLESVAVGIQQARPAELPSILRQLAIAIPLVLNELANEAEKYLTLDEPDDTHL